MEVAQEADVPLPSLEELNWCLGGDRNVAVVGGIDRTVMFSSFSCLPFGMDVVWSGLAW